MSTLLQELKDKISIIDQSFKYTVTGYIRELQQNSSSDNTPPLILYLVLAFYCKPNEYFATARHGFEISNNNMTLTKVNTVA